MKAKFWIRFAAVALFLLLLGLPGILTVFGVSGASSTETAVEKPSLTQGYSAFPDACEKAYSVSFPLRGAFLKLNTWVSWKLLGTAPGDEVIAGNSGFLFLRDTAQDFTAQRELDDSEVSALADMLLEIQNALQTRGTSFVLAVAPNKNSVYPEKMPLAYLQGEDTVYDRLLSACLERGVHMPDLKSALLSAKSEGLVYYKTDTHWNDLGALCAYREIAKAAGAGWDLYESAAMTKKRITGDLSGTMLGLSVTETAPACGVSGFTATEDDYYASELGTEGMGQTRALVFRDSFGTALVPYIAQTTRWAFYTRVLPYDFSAAGDADVVILEIAERNLSTLLSDLSVPEFPDQPETEETEQTVASVQEIGADIPEPEPFDKDALPESLADVEENEDIWDEYDPFSEKPGATPTEETAGEEGEDLASWQLLCVPERDAVLCTVLGDAADGTLQIRPAAGGELLQAQLTYGRFEIQGLQSDTEYAARAVVDGVTLNFRFTTQNQTSCCTELSCEALENGISFTWQGEDGRYSFYRADFSEGEEERVAQIEGKTALLPYSGRIQSHYRIAFESNGQDGGFTAPISLYTPLLELPSSDKAIEGQEIFPIVSRTGQMILIMRRDIDGIFSVPVRVTLTSTGQAEERTPLGTYRIWKKQEWFKWAEGQYSQYNMSFAERLKLHSVLFKEKGAYDEPIYEMREKLGRAVSGGCLRQTVTDAKWLYEHMELEYRFTILDGPTYPTLKKQLKNTLPAL